MSFGVLCDEHVPPETAECLRALDHEASTVQVAVEPGASDERIARFAAAENWIVLTNDTDFLDEDRFPDVTVCFYSESDEPGPALATAIDDLASYVESLGELPDRIYL